MYASTGLVSVLFFYLMTHARDNDRWLKRESSPRVTVLQERVRYPDTTMTANARCGIAECGARRVMIYDTRAR